MKVKFKKLHFGAQTPKYAKPGDAAMDLYAVEVKKHIDSISDQTTKLVIDSGIAIEIPEGFVGLLFPRSSVQSTGLRLTNGVGVIDSGYRGSIKAVFDIIDSSLMYYEEGDRFAQLMIIPHPPVEFEEVQELSSTERGEGGFGSTGILNTNGETVTHTNTKPEFVTTTTLYGKTNFRG
jgi:dUTP pyrophosphatase